jgi:hypothetical protein
MLRLESLPRFRPHSHHVGVFTFVVRSADLLGVENMNEIGCEFRFVEDPGYKLPPAERSLITVRRLATLARIAARLQLSHWPMWFTASGLAFSPPGNYWYDDYDVANEKIVAELLDELNIDEAFSLTTSRIVAEMPERWIDHSSTGSDY